MLCEKHMAYAAIGEGLDDEPAIRLSGQKDSIQKTGILTLQGARLPCDKRMAYAAVGGGIDAEPAIGLSDRKDSIQKRAPGLCRMPDCHAISAGPMLRSEGGWMLNLRLDSPIGRIAYKNGHPDFAGCPIAMQQVQGLCCGRKGLDNGPTIRPLSRKEQHTKSGTLTLQDVRLPCDKRMAYAAVGGRIGAKPAIRLPDRKDSIQKRAL